MFRFSNIKRSTQLNFTVFKWELGGLNLAKDRAESSERFVDIWDFFYTWIVEHTVFGIIKIGNIVAPNGTKCKYQKHPIFTI